MTNLYCQETMYHRESNDPDKRYSLGMGEVYETAHETTGSLYRACSREFGRCIGKVYIDDVAPLGTTTIAKQVGWVFLKKNPEGDGCIETLVEVYTKPPVRRVVIEGGTHPKFRK
jgi:hypothetical protein